MKHHLTFVIQFWACLILSAVSVNPTAKLIYMPLAVVALIAMYATRNDE